MTISHLSKCETKLQLLRPDLSEIYFEHLFSGSVYDDNDDGDLLVILMLLMVMMVILTMMTIGTHNRRQ